MRTILTLILLIPTLLAGTLHKLTVSDLDFQNNKEATEALKQTIWLTWGNTGTQVLLPTEAYLGALPDGDNNRTTQGDQEIVFRAPDNTPIKGFIHLEISGNNAQTIKSYPITLDPKKLKTTTPKHFQKIKQAHYKNLTKNHLPGTPYFKHLAGPEPEENRQRWNRTELADTFSIFAGGRAISENLALDRELLLAESKDKKTTPLSEIKGVTVTAIDWTGKLPKTEIKIDPLALQIPVDQHALFAPSLDSLFNLIDLVEKEGAPLLQTYTVRNPFRQLPSKYRSQIGLDFPPITAKLLPIKSVAVTGGDPFFPMGTDIAVLFETEKPEALYNTLQKAIQLKASTQGATQQKIQAKNYTATGYQNPTRTFSSYIIRHGNLVAVTNSPTQIKTLAAVQENKTPSLGSTDEFKYFRHRYPISKKIFIFLSDETIRRWSGPEIRIGASRRTRAAAALGKLTAQHIAKQKLTTDLTPLLGESTITNNQIQSQTFNNLNFLTPVSELNIKTATASETAAYNQWRQGYESGWATVFDPIAIELDLQKDSHEIDLTVLPLTVNSSLNNFLQLVGNAKLSPLARATPEGTLLLASMAIDSNSGLFKDFNTELTSMLPGVKVNPLSWVGQSASIYINDGFIWKALQEAEPNADMISQLPILIRVESKSQLKLALFLTAIKGMSETSAPGLIKWQQNKHKDTPYVTLVGNEKEIGSSITIHYAALPTAFLITLDEDMLKQAIDRENTPLTEAQKQTLPEAQHLFADTSPLFLAGANKIFNDENLKTQTQQESYKALPILNEWHRLYPNQDPVKIHKQLFGTDIHCPGGKGYQWNPKALTMESTALGHPANPRSEGNPIPLLTKFANLKTSISFKDGGARIRAKLGPTGSRIPIAKTEAPKGKILATAKELTHGSIGKVFTFTRTTNGEKTDTLKSILTKKETTKNGTLYLVEETRTSQNESQKFKVITELNDKGLFYLSNTSENASSNFPIPYQLLPAQLEMGKTYVTQFKSIYKQKGKTSVGNSERSITVVGTEDITVEAGTFKDAIKLNSIEKTVVNGLYLTKQITTWVHKDGAQIKSISKSKYQTSTIELKSIKTP